jgi:alkylation response protein AidB-like acyl-CoA dehydrogenase
MTANRTVMPTAPGGIELAIPDAFRRDTTGGTGACPIASETQVRWLRTAPRAKESTLDAFRINEEQELFRQTVRQLAEEKIAPRAAEIDESDSYPADMHELLARNELMAVGYPEEVGGSGGPVEFCLLVEEISRVSAGVSLIPLVNRLGAIPIMLAGSDAQRKEILGAVVRGERQLAYCLTEPGSGSDAAAMRSRAVRDEGGWVIYGSKRFITKAVIADNYI